MKLTGKEWKMVEEKKIYRCKIIRVIVEINYYKLIDIYCYHEMV